MFFWSTCVAIIAHSLLMEFFGLGSASELESPLGQLVKSATDPLLLGPDWAKNLEICDNITNSTEGYVMCCCCFRMLLMISSCCCGQGGSGSSNLSSIKKF